jgi:hypothetical protein
MSLEFQINQGLLFSALLKIFTLISQFILLTVLASTYLQILELVAPLSCCNKHDLLVWNMLSCI